MIRAGIIGLGKMGISHCSILNAQPNVALVAVCDTSKIILAAFKKYTDIECFKDYRKMIDKSNLDCLFVATPTKFHAEMAMYAMEKNIHTFIEKPFCLNLDEGRKMVDLAESKNLVNQIGYHNRFIGTFQKARRLLEKHVIGEVYHVLGESYGPVVLRAKRRTWRSSKSEGGGCLYDYVSHVVNLVVYLVGPPSHVKGTVLKKIYSSHVEDAVYSTILYNNRLSGQLCVNWSDETYRKMSTKITILGTGGKIISDAQECKIYLRESNVDEGLQKGWNIHYITDTTPPVGFNLRGEEYSAQIEYFINCIKKKKKDNINSFASALRTDTIIDLLEKDAEGRGESYG